MPLKTKTFDCVEMKNELQKAVLDDHRHLGEEEAHRRYREWVETSDDLLAAWWRKVEAKAFMGKSERG